MKRAVGISFIILLNILVFLALALLVMALPKTADAQIQVTPVPDPLCRTAPVLLWRLPCNEYHDYVILRYVCETYQPIPNHLVFWDDVAACQDAAPGSASITSYIPIVRGWSAQTYALTPTPGQFIGTWTMSPPDPRKDTPTPAPTMCPGWWERGMCDPTATPFIIGIGPTPTPTPEGGE